MSQKSALAASIVGMALLFAGSSFARSTVTVDLTKTKQSIRGFGCMIHFRPFMYILVEWLSGKVNGIP